MFSWVVYPKQAKELISRNAVSLHLAYPLSHFAQLSWKIVAIFHVLEVPCTCACHARAKRKLINTANTHRYVSAIVVSLGRRETSILSRTMNLTVLGSGCAFTTVMNEISSGPSICIIFVCLIHTLKSNYFLSIDWSELGQPVDRLAELWPAKLPSEKSIMLNKHLHNGSFSAHCRSCRFALFSGKTSRSVQFHDCRLSSILPHVSLFVVNCVI